MRAIYWLFIAIGICLALILILRYILRPGRSGRMLKERTRYFQLKLVCLSILLVLSGAAVVGLWRMMIVVINF